MLLRCKAKIIEGNHKNTKNKMIKQYPYKVNIIIFRSESSYKKTQSNKQTIKK